MNYNFNLLAMPTDRFRGFWLMAIAKACDNSSNALRLSPVNALSRRSSFSTRLMSSIFLSYSNHQLLLYLIKRQV